MTKRAKVLIIDDDQDLNVAIETLLGLKDFEVLSATNADDGVRLAREQHPDVILLDILLSPRSGIEVYRELRADSTRIASRPSSRPAGRRRTSWTSRWSRRRWSSESGNWSARRSEWMGGPMDDWMNGGRASPARPLPSSHPAARPSVRRAASPAWS